jgi:hypothetical protein
MKWIIDLSDQNNKLAEKSTNLLTNSKGIYVAVGNIPVEEPVRVLSIYETQDHKNGRQKPCSKSC